MKKTFSLIGVCLVLLIVTATIFGPYLIKSYIEERLVTYAAEQQVPLSLKGTRGHFFGFSGREAQTTVLLGPIPLPVMIEGFRIDFSPHSLLCSKAVFTTKASIYGGGFSSSSSIDLKRSSFNNSITVQELQLAKHPFLAGLGIRSGNLTGIVPNFVISGDYISSGKIILLIRKLNIPQNTIIPGFLLKRSEPLVLPPLTNADLTLQASIQTHSIMRLTLHFNSSLATLTGKGWLPLPSKEVQDSGSLKARITLSDLGRKQLLPLIEQLLGKQFQNEVRVFSLSWEKGQWSLEPIIKG